MGYFPFFVDLEDKRGLVAGGGTVALRKLEKLLPYGPRLTVVSLEFREEIRRLPGLTLLQRAFCEDMLEGQYFVIAATDDRELNHRISRLCQEKHILVNVVDDKEACSFIFPSLVKRGKLSVGISTQGASPTGAIRIKEQLCRWIPENFDEILEFLERKRPAVKAMIPEEERRGEIFSRLYERCMEEGRGLTEEEFDRLTRGGTEGGGKL